MTLATLHGSDAQTRLQHAVRTLKETGFWTHTDLRRDVVHHITQAGTYEIAPQDGDRVFIIADNDATITEKTRNATTAVTIIVGENAHVTYASHTGGHTTITRFAHLADDASIHWIDLSDGEHVSAHVTTYLAGKGSDARFASCFLGTDDQRYSVESDMIHAGDNSTSHMLTRAALLGHSRGSYDGLIKILPQAKNCDAYQRGECLLLSKDARMHAEPNLEIGNEEVKCSHGVSLSRIDEEQLFYFRARGIATRDAQKLIVEGFFADIIDQLPHGADTARAQVARRIA